MGKVKSGGGVGWVNTEGVLRKRERKRLRESGGGGERGGCTGSKRGMAGDRSRERGGGDKQTN